MKDRRRRLYLQSIAGGAGFAACWLPFGLAPAMPLSALLIVRALRRATTAREAMACGILIGIAQYVVGSHFLLALTKYSVPLGVAFYLLAIASILPYWLIASWGAWTLERRFGVPRAAGVVLLFVLLERLRTLGDTSFPADLASHAFGTNPAWLAWNPWIGPFGFTLLVFAVGALLDQAIERRRRSLHAAGIAALGLALWAGPPISDRLFYGSAQADETRRTASPSGAVRVGIVQPVIEVRHKLDRERWPELWARLEQLTLSIAGDVDLVIWPETTRPGPVIWEGDAPFSDVPMEQLADRVGVPILYGCEIARIEGGHVVALYNGAALARPGGEPGDWYGKQRLLPFAEGVPFARLLGWDPARRERTPGRRSLLSLLGNFSPGPRPTVFEVGPARLGVLICYEGFYASLGRGYRLAGANALVVVTNDAWWGRSVFAPWHAKMMASQARSLDLPVIRAANSGVSSATDRRGRMTDSTRLFEVTTMQVLIAPADSPPTFFARHGNLVPGAIVGFLIAAALVSAGRRVFKRR